MPTGLNKVILLCVCGADGAVRPKQWLSRPPPIQKFGAENLMLQLNI